MKSCDLEASGSKSQSLDVEFCIVGSGAAGLPLACDLLKNGHSVVICESGGSEIEPSSQKLNHAILRGVPHNGSLHDRYRVIGGSTRVWGGQAMRFRPQDLAARPWLDLREWPIPHQELAKYYPAAEQFMELSEQRDDSFAKGLGVNEISEATHEKLRLVYSRFTKKTDLRQKLFQQYANHDSLHIWSHAHLVSLDANDGSVGQAVFKSLNGNELVVRAKHYILACGTVENCRMLLNLAREIIDPQAYEQCGRGFCDHPATFVGEIISDEPSRINQWFNLYRTSEGTWQPRLEFDVSHEAKIKSRSCTATFNFRYVEGSDIQRCQELTRKLFRRDFVGFAKALASSLASIVSSIGIIGSMLCQRYFFNRNYSPKAKILLGVSSEETVQSGSHIRLDEEQTDQFGLKLAVIDWTPGEGEMRTIIAMTEMVDEMLKKLNLGHVKKYDFLNSDLIEFNKNIWDLRHPCGSTCMAAQATDGVVDENLRCFGTKNLYVTGSSVFPSGYHSNPTLTIIALSQRLAAYLHKHAH